jgi:hypothetical protein
MDDTTQELVKYYRMRVQALEDELALTRQQRDEASALANEFIKRSTHLFHQTQRNINTDNL